ncbi:LysR family transcriptional regulator [Vibrio marisflavi]|uniref:HTH lysR-type domain-containing protein n=1 Tax=Vibrio marisflavi CECT 7928 TaxID=634439 RepID=A0ABM8ZZR7_9VIBR|nr:LysR family transcriptional regulator [Vibrio marisflavi]CAH0536544.1 hypothetical protein VMF7928_00497 [Vibrio marisflavi CECT 7928]
MDMERIQQLSGLGNISINHVRYFISLYELGSLSKAAKDCGVTQPSISKSIKSLENQLDIVLFNRDTRKCYPTAAATQLYPRFVELCTTALAVSNSLNVIKSGDFGEANLGFGQLIAPLASRITAKILSANYTDLKTKIVQDTPNNLQRRLLQGELDFFICHDEAIEHSSLVEQIVFKPFAEIQLAAVAAPTAYFLAKGDDITTYPWAFPNIEMLKTSKNNFYSNYYLKIRESKSILFEVDDAEARLELAISGRAATVSSRLSLGKYIDSGSLISLPISIDSINLGVFYLSTKPLTQNMKSLINSLKCYFKAVSK